jgi:transcriptional/translational regulatory protein YebC/TACO1
MMEVAVGAGAEDYELAGDEWSVTTPPDQLNTVVDALDKGKIAAKGSSIAYVPKNKKPVSGRDAEVALNLVDALDDHDDVQNVYADFDISDEDLAKLEK